MQNMENTKSRESKHIIGTYILYATGHAKDQVPFSKALQDYRASKEIRLFEDNEVVKPKMTEKEASDFQILLKKQVKELRRCIDLCILDMPFDEKKIKLALQIIGKKLEEIIQPIRVAFEAEIKEEKAMFLAKEKKQEKITLSAEEQKTINIILDKYAIRIFLLAGSHLIVDLEKKWQREAYHRLREALVPDKSSEEKSPQDENSKEKDPEDVLYDNFIKAMGEAFTNKKFTVASLEESKKILERNLINPIFLNALQEALYYEKSGKQELLPLTHFLDIYAALNSIIDEDEENRNQLKATQKMLTEVLADKIDAYCSTIESSFKEKGFNAVNVILDNLVKILNIVVIPTAEHKNELFNIKIGIVALLLNLKQVELSSHEQNQNQEPKLSKHKQKKLAAEISPLDNLIYIAQRSCPDVFRSLPEIQKEIHSEAQEPRKTVKLRVREIGKAYEDNRKENKVNYPPKADFIKRKPKITPQEDEQEKSEESVDKSVVSSIKGDNNTVNSYSTFASKASKVTRNNDEAKASEIEHHAPEIKEKISRIAK
jgi:hypothetical protein